jgi:hypothetical protein
MYERIGLDRHQTWRHYLARLDDRRLGFQDHCLLHTYTWHRTT